MRSTGHSTETRLVAVMVRPSSGRPRRADSGQAMTLSGTASRVRARVVPAAATTTPDEHREGDDPARVADHGRRHEQRGEHGAERSSTGARVARDAPP